MSKVRDILAEAQRLAEKSKTWADLSNALFDPLDGLVPKSFTETTDRAAFRKSDAYEHLHKLVEQKMLQTGVLAGSVPKKSGRFVVRVPRSLHAALEQEAAAEGTSLNQLVLAKLSARFGSLLGGKTASIIQAFGEVRKGCSEDRVVADPALNRQFLQRCRELGLSGTDFDLNWALFTARKNGLMSDLPETKRFTVVAKDEFEYASELAVRHLQLTQHVSLDRVICDPDLAHEFDQYAMKLAPGYTPLDYRWAALSLRKAGRLRKDLEGRIEVPKLEPVCRVAKLKASSLPNVAGLYLFTSDEKPVFLSHSDNLRHRLERHMEFSDSQGLPRWLWGEGPLDLAVAEMPGVIRGLRLGAEILLVKNLHPILNYPRTAA
jgi:site-specific DNA-methyltransferase (adenine-specific)